MPTNLEYRKRGRQRKRESRATEKELEQERKHKGDIFGWRKNMKFCSCGEKMRNACVHQGENERREKKVNMDTYDIFSIKWVTRKFLEVSTCSRPKQWQTNVQKSVLHMRNCF